MAELQAEIESDDEDEELNSDLSMKDLRELDEFFEQEEKRQMKKKRVSQADVFLTFLREMKDIHRHRSLVILSVYSLVIPASTAGVERVIKVIKAIKCRVRMRLTTKMLKKLLVL